MRTAVIAVAAVAVLGLTACEKDAQPGTVQGSAPGTQTQAAATSTAPSTPPPAGAIKSYDCTKLLSNAEARAATGLAFSLVDPKNGATDPDGFTDCGYFAPDGTYMQASVWTGPSYQQDFLPLVQAARAGAAEPIGGIGDEAGWSSQSTSLGVRVGSTGITIAYELFGGPGPADMKGSAIKLANVVISHL